MRAWLPHCEGRGLMLHRMTRTRIDCALKGWRSAAIVAFVMAHVLEHIDDSAAALRQIFQSCARLGVERVIIIVPGAKGFDSDATHKTFVNRHYMQQHHLLNCEGYAMKSSGYFPGNWEWIGRYFVFHEFFIVYDKTA